MKIPQAVYKRIVLKLSGEALQGGGSHGIDSRVLVFAGQLTELRAMGVQVAWFWGEAIFSAGGEIPIRALNRTRRCRLYGDAGHGINGLALQNR